MGTVLQHLGFALRAMRTQFETDKGTFKILEIRRIFIQPESGQQLEHTTGIRNKWTTDTSKGRQSIVNQVSTWWAGLCVALHEWNLDINAYGNFEGASAN